MPKEEPVQETTEPPRTLRKRFFNSLLDKLGGKTTSSSSTTSKHQLTGDGVRVGIIDTGVDYYHPALGGGPNRRVLFSQGFGPGRFTGRPDIKGHGTHVAGILAGNSRDFSGFAPNSVLGNYNIFGDVKGPTRNSHILQALEQSKKDAMQVVNLSLGSPEWADDPVAVAASLLASKGVVVVGTVGNDGKRGLFRADSPGVGNNVISVAACFAEDDQQSETRLQRLMDRDSTLRTLGVTSEKYVPLTSERNIDQNVPLTALFLSSETTNEDTDNEACDAQSLDPSHIRHRAILIRLTGCPLSEKVSVLSSLGAAAVLIEHASPTTLDNVTAAIPVLSVSTELGTSLRKQLWSIRYRSGLFYQQCKGIASFSSWGPEPDFRFKPDITAVVREPLFLPFIAYHNHLIISYPILIGTECQLNLPQRELLPAQRYIHGSSPCFWFGSPLC
jgi:subtilisin family serine protease